MTPSPIELDDGQFPRLSAEEIDDLCERLNCR